MNQLKLSCFLALLLWTAPLVGQIPSVTSFVDCTVPANVADSSGRSAGFLDGKPVGFPLAQNLGTHMIYPAGSPSSPFAERDFDKWSSYDAFLLAALGPARPCVQARIIGDVNFPQLGQVQQLSYAKQSGVVCPPPPPGTGCVGLDCHCPVWPCDTTPLVVDLRGDGFLLSGRSDSVLFDLDGDGELELTTWTTESQDDAFLVLDRNRSGTIDSGRELFGNSTSIGGGELAEHGFAAVSELDLPAWGGNGDGTLDRSDRAFRRLRLWLDSDADGVSQPSELFRLRRFGIREISLTYWGRWVSDVHGNIHGYMGYATSRDGSYPIPISDVLFVVGQE